MKKIIPKEARRILERLASGWSDVADSKASEVVHLKGAMTNEVYQINWRSEGKDVASRKVLLRIYGEGVDVFFNREDEIRTFESMSRYGQGPRLLGRFPNGRIEEFINARTLSATDLRDPEISALIASKLKEFHDLDMPGPLGQQCIRMGQADEQVNDIDFDYMEYAKQRFQQYWLRKFATLGAG